MRCAFSRWKLFTTKIDVAISQYDMVTSILKVYKTINDAEAANSINGSHSSEAIQYRSMDREGWLG